MPLSPEQEWTLVACGLIAHADGVLEVGEWDQVLWMLDDRVDAAEAEHWVDILCDQAQLRQRFESLPLPAPLFTDTVLEKSWRMALADGVGSDEESRIHDEIAQRLGAEMAALAGQRAAWTKKAAARAELAAGFAAVLANLDGSVDSAEIAAFDDLLRRLPLPQDSRAVLRQYIDAPPGLDALVGGFMALEPEERKIALAGLVPIVLAARRGDRERLLFCDLAERIAIDRDSAERMLER